MQYSNLTITFIGDKGILLKTEILMTTYELK